MRVAAVVNLYPQLTESWIRLQLLELSRRGTDVSLYALGRGVGERNFPYTPQYVGHAWPKLPGRFMKLGPSKTLAAFTTSFRDAASVLIPHRLEKPLNESGADLIHCHFGHVGSEVVSTLRKPKVPLLVSFYGFDAYRLPRVWGGDLFQPLFHRARAVLSLGPSMDQRLLALGCPVGLLRRLPLGVDTGLFRFSPRRPGATIRVFSVARLVEKKGLFIGMEAVARLQKQLGVPVEYVIAGHGPLLRPLQKQAGNTPSGMKVTFLGALSPERIQEAMENSDVCLVPSVTARDGDAEGTPVVALEAMAMGRPVVATDCGDLPSLLGQGDFGALAAERDSTTLALAMESALAGGADWDSRLHAARAHVEAHHSPEAVGDALTALYRQAFH